jgi:hypothetical protein
MIGEIYFQQLNYKEVVIAEKDGLLVLDCQMDGKTILLRIEHRDRLQAPDKHKLRYSKEAITALLKYIKVEDF